MNFLPLIKWNQQNYLINIWLTYCLCAIGKVCEVQTLCSIINLPRLPSRFLPYVEVLVYTREAICFKTMKDAVEETVEGMRSTGHPIDHQWHMTEVVTATSSDTSKVVDVSIVSKLCIFSYETKHLPQLTTEDLVRKWKFSGLLKFSKIMSTYNVSVHLSQYLDHTPQNQLLFLHH